ncbi:dihydrolipoyllysine-residue acetyltransferase component 4 of pyruvate dehydrogenase complex, chloroplastic-like isoform X4 [Rutidosis leptorrhynchoides]|uniref:dihydrolipoyllysine-residue acetyltransferase component 4 of pyruvate dehydrogenase complex, chloroplastic-like isoform X4 n=1 Tax=Rutidosis leptorrhynchoides TaxID=125765 RepID=UPI003A9A4653
MFRVDRFDTILPPGQGAIMAVGASKPTSVTDKDGIFSVKTKITVTHQQDNKSATTKFSINAYSGFDSAVSASISIGVLLPALNACFKVNVMVL